MADISSNLFAAGGLGGGGGGSVGSTEGGGGDSTTSGGGGGGASAATPSPSPPRAAEIAQAVEQAASTLTQILATQDALGVDTAQQVTAFVSDLIGLQSATQAADESGDGAAASTAEAAEDTASKQRAAAESIHTAVVQLAAAVTTTVGAGEVVLTSANLNLTTEARRPEQLATRPIQCATSAAAPATVKMPTSILDAAVGANTSLPIAVMLYTTPFNLHTPANRSDAAAVYGTRSLPAGASPTVSFSLLQAGRPLRVRDAQAPINVSVPYSPSNGSAAACIGEPEKSGNASDASSACASFIECRWWNASGDGSWSKEGCVTVATAEGAFTCSCDHLTDCAMGGSNRV